MAGQDMESSIDNMNQASNYENPGAFAVPGADDDVECLGETNSVETVLKSCGSDSSKNEKSGMIVGCEGERESGDGQGDHHSVKVGDTVVPLAEDDTQDSRGSSPEFNIVSSGNKSTGTGGSVPVVETSKSKKKEDKSIEHILRALNSLSTSEEKLAALCKKYSDLLEDHRLQQTKLKQNQRKLGVIVREKEHLQNEHGKAVLAKSKLENLCRELQRHNKLVKEESLARAREEEERRKEITSKFQTTINDIQQQMNDHYTKNTKLREENVELANKLKNLIEQYELREQHIEKVFKHKDLEQQLVDAKLAQANLQLHEDKEKNIKEKQELLEGAVAAQEKINQLEGQEKQLRAQVALYTEKYEEFQSTLSKSNEVFQTFKAEMDKMTKKIKKLEKDTTMWRTRWENSNKALLDMAEEKTKSDKEISTLRAKVARLEKLCRALQSDSYKNASNGVTAKQNDLNSDQKAGEKQDDTVIKEPVDNVEEKQEIEDVKPANIESN